MYQESCQNVAGAYALATGEAATYRLRLLHGLYGPGTRRLLLEAGLRRGMRVADVGCGVGLVTALLAKLVGPEGQVIGIDFSGAQLTRARERLAGSGTSASFVEASATDTGLPPGSFDLVYCRFLLLHLPEPERALGEMRSLLKPGGTLVCEDGDLTSSGSEPPSALAAFADLWCRLGPRRGLDYNLGRRLFHMVLAAGFPAPEITFNQPVVARVRSSASAVIRPASIKAGPASATDSSRKRLFSPRATTGWLKVISGAGKPAASTIWKRRRPRV